MHLNCGNYMLEGRDLPSLSASASKDSEGKVHISLVNIDPENATELLIDLRGGDYNSVSGRILTSDRITAHNTYDNPRNVIPEEFKGAKIRKNIVSLSVPPKAIVVLEIDK